MGGFVFLPSIFLASCLIHGIEACLLVISELVFLRVVLSEYFLGSIMHRVQTITCENLQAVY